MSSCLLLLVLLHINLVYAQWTTFSGSQYRNINTPTTWSSARSDCQNQGGDLVVITSQAESDWIEQNILTTEAWLGLTDSAVEGVWQWVDGTPLLPGFENWAAGNPNDVVGAQDCARFSPFSGFAWDDVSCTLFKPYVCERPAPLQCIAQATPADSTVSVDSTGANPAGCDDCVGAVVTYTCNLGFIPNNDPNLDNVAATCTAGGWDTPAPTCEPLCPLPVSPQNGGLSININGAACALPNCQGAVITFTCDPGAFLNGNPALDGGSLDSTCQTDGTWDPAVPTCTVNGVVDHAGGYCNDPNTLGCVDMMHAACAPIFSEFVLAESGWYWLKPQTPPQTPFLTYCERGQVTGYTMLMATEWDFSSNANALATNYSTFYTDTVGSSNGAYRLAGRIWEDLATQQRHNNWLVRVTPRSQQDNETCTTLEFRGDSMFKFGQNDVYLQSATSQHDPFTPFNQGSTIGEVGRVSVTGTNWTPVTLQNSFVGPVVIPVPIATTGLQGNSSIITVRMRWTSVNRFELRLQQPDGTNDPQVSTLTMIVSYWVVEEGVHQIGPNTVLQAGSFTTDKLHKNGFSVAPFLTPFATAPAVLSHVQTLNLPDVYVVSRQHNVSTDGFEVALSHAHDFRDTHPFETIGWIALENVVETTLYSGSRLSVGQVEILNTTISIPVSWNADAMYDPSFVATVGTYSPDVLSTITYDSKSRTSVELSQQAVDPVDLDVTLSTVNYFMLEKDQVLIGTAWGTCGAANPLPWFYNQNPPLNPCCNFCPATSTYWGGQFHPSVGPRNLLAGVADSNGVVVDNACPIAGTLWSDGTGGAYYGVARMEILLGTPIVQCSDSAYINNGTVTVSDNCVTCVGTALTFSCDESFTLNGEAPSVYNNNLVSVCQADGSWLPAIPTCQSIVVCGNGLMEVGETCDDGNTVDGDGCDGSCRVENVLGQCTCADPFFVDYSLPDWMRPQPPLAANPVDATLQPLNTGGVRMCVTITTPYVNGGFWSVGSTRAIGSVSTLPVDLPAETGSQTYRELTVLPGADFNPFELAPPNTLKGACFNDNPYSVPATDEWTITANGCYQERQICFDPLATDIPLGCVRTEFPTEVLINCDIFVDLIRARSLTGDGAPASLVVPTQSFLVWGNHVGVNGRISMGVTITTDVAFVIPVMTVGVLADGHLEARINLDFGASGWRVDLGAAPPTIQGDVSVNYTLSVDSVSQLTLRSAQLQPLYNDEIIIRVNVENVNNADTSTITLVVQPEARNAVVEPQAAGILPEALVLASATGNPTDATPNSVVGNGDTVVIVIPFLPSVTMLSMTVDLKRLADPNWSLRLIDSSTLVAPQQFQLTMITDQTFLSNLNGETGFSFIPAVEFGGRYSVEIEFIYSIPFQVVPSKHTTLETQEKLPKAQTLDVSDDQPNVKIVKMFQRIDIVVDTNTGTITEQVTTYYSVGEQTETKESSVSEPQERSEEKLTGSSHTTATTSQAGLNGIVLVVIGLVGGIILVCTFMILGACVWRCVHKEKKPSVPTGVVEKRSTVVYSFPGGLEDSHVSPKRWAQPASIRRGSTFDALPDAPEMQL